MTLDEIKVVFTVVGVLVALFTLIKGILEYSRQGAQKRAEHFIDLRKRLKENQSFKQICGYLELDEKSLLGVDFKDKRDFLGFFEEVAILLNSKLISEPVAHYMFGYYAIRCWESENFWSDVNRNSYYWALFQDFVSRMKKRESNFSYKRREYRF